MGVGWWREGGPNDVIIPVCRLLCCVVVVVVVVVLVLLLVLLLLSASLPVVPAHRVDRGSVTRHRPTESVQTAVCARTLFLLHGGEPKLQIHHSQSGSRRQQSFACVLEDQSKEEKIPKTLSVSV